MSDDWFERALEGSGPDETVSTDDDDTASETDTDDETAAKSDENDNGEVPADAAETADERPDDDTGIDGDTDGSDDATERELSFGAGEFDLDDAPAPDPGRESDATADRADDSRRDSDAASTSDANANTNSDDGPLFEEGFGDALQDVDVPDIGAPENGADGVGGSGSGAGPDSGGVGVQPGDPDGFDDVDFGLAGPDQPDFEDDVESALPRLDLGIDGLDRMIQGGVPERSLMVAIGSAGTGKTTFGLQFLEHGLEQGESAVFIALEESRQRVIDSATEKGFAFDEYVAEDRLAVVDLDPIEMTNSLASIRNELPRLVAEFDAERLVLDSVSLLEMMYDDRARRRNEIYDFTKGLKEAGVTALLTSEAAEDTPYASRHGIVEYLTDAVFVLQYVRPDDFRETRLAIEIQKIRDANHSREKKPYELTDSGISVYQQANLF